MVAPVDRKPVTPDAKTERKYLNIVRHYESCLEKHGDTHLGVDWPKVEQVDARYKVMLEVIRDAPSEPVQIMDFGCGASHLYEYILKRNIRNIVYSGLDLSKAFVSLSQRKFPLLTYYCVDVLDDHTDLPIFDYVVMNGVFTEKRDLTFEEMFAYFKRMITRVFQLANVGIAFNVMSKHVDWEREDLFHLPLDILAEFLTESISRKYVMRNDYGLYEYTVYVYK